MYHQRKTLRRGSVFGVVLASYLGNALLTGCKDRGSPKGESTDTAKSAAPEGSVSLPEYYGVYGIDGAKTVELRATRHALGGGVELTSERPDFTSRVEFLAFNKLVATGLYTIKLGRIETPTTMSDLMDMRPGEFQRFAPVQHRLKPVEGKPEMVRVVPTDGLLPGLYVFNDEFEFTIGGPHKETKVWMCATCSEAFDLTARQYVGMMKQSGDAGRLICPKCKDTKLCQAVRCEKCQTAYFSSLMPGAIGVCPKCNPNYKRPRP